MVGDPAYAQWGDAKVALLYLTSMVGDFNSACI